MNAEYIRAAVGRAIQSIRDDENGVRDERTALQTYGSKDIEQALRVAAQELKDIVRWAEAELSRREAERAERAKLIDAEWLNEILGSQWSFESPTLGGAMVTIWKTKLIKSGWGLGILHRSTETVHCLNATTRGQLLDLLAALKGGAT